MNLARLSHIEESQEAYPFLNKKFKDFSRTFKDTFPIFQGLHSVQKRVLSLPFLVLPQHDCNFNFLS